MRTRFEDVESRVAPWTPATVPGCKTRMAPAANRGDDFQCPACNASLGLVVLAKFLDSGWLVIC